jgi:hypothetical protein
MYMRKKKGKMKKKVMKMLDSVGGTKQLTSVIPTLMVDAARSSPISFVEEIASTG